MSTDDIRAELDDAGRQRGEAKAVMSTARERLARVISRADEAGIPVAEIARRTGLSRMGVYKVLEAADPAPDDKRICPTCHRKVTVRICSGPDGRKHEPARTRPHRETETP